jgi:hypothetical protein
MKIEKNVPIESFESNLKKGTYTTVLRKMEIGDSFLVPDGKEYSLRVVCSLEQKNRGFVYRILKVEMNKYRCWRVK